MKNNYLYQGWAGNTYSHKCNSLNSLNSSSLYFKLKKDITPDTDGGDAIGPLTILASEVLVKTQNLCTSNILGVLNIGDNITKDVLRAFRLDLPCFIVNENFTIPPSNSPQEVLKNMGMDVDKIDELLEEITETEYNSIRDNMVKELEEELKVN